MFHLNHFAAWVGLGLILLWTMVETYLALHNRVTDVGRAGGEEDHD